jgi:uncharacterized protein (TIGR03086 family)
MLGHPDAAGGGQETAMPEDGLDQLARALADTATVVEGVREDQWDLPTPCSQWTVRDVVRHLVAGHHIFARALEDRPSSTEGTDVVPDRQWRTAYRTSADILLEAFATPGALERPLTIPFGTVPGSVALHLRLVEALVHGWDVARASDRALPHDQGLAEQELAWARPWLAKVPADRSPFAPPLPVPDHASPLDRLVACLGRDVGAWGASS